MSIIPIQVTLQAASAADYRQLVHDLAGTMSSSSAAPAAPVVQAPAQAPAQQPAYADQQQPYAAPVQQPYVAPMQQQPAAYPAGVPTSAVPTAAPMQQQPVQQQQPMQQQPIQHQQPTQQAVPTSAPQYTQQQLAVAATALLDAGHNVTVLLQQFGVQAITQLPPERYGEFATALRQAGANI